MLDTMKKVEDELELQDAEAERLGALLRVANF